MELLKSKIRPKDLPLFFWNHLKKDISIVSQATGKSKDEVCLILHMILRDISVKSLPSCKYTVSYIYVIVRTVLLF